MKKSAHETRPVQETPQKRRARLLEERRELIRTTPLKELRDRFSKELNVTQKYELKPTHTHEGGLLISLHHKGRYLGDASTEISKRDSRISLEMGPIQGIQIDDGIHHRAFREDIGKSFNLSLAQSIIDASFKAGFDEVTMMDIRKTHDYEYVHAKTKEEIEKIRHRMLTQQGEIAKEFGFTRNGDYFVRKFH